MSEKRQVTIYLVEELHRRAKMEAARRGMSLSDLTARALKDLLKQSPPRGVEGSFRCGPSPWETEHG